MPAYESIMYQRALHMVNLCFLRAKAHTMGVGAVAKVRAKKGEKTGARRGEKMKTTGEKMKTTCVFFFEKKIFAGLTGLAARLWRAHSCRSATATCRSVLRQ